MTNDSPQPFPSKISQSATPARVRIALAILLLGVFVLMQLRLGEEPASGDVLAWRDDGRLHVFVHPDCPHCHDARAFLRDHPEIDFDIHDVSTPANERLFRAVARDYGLSERDLGVPLFIFGDQHMLGFDRPETTGVELLAMVRGDVQENTQSAGHIDLPIIGTIDPDRYSLAGLAVIMGLADGFNPCAMWVLIYLISLIAGLKDRAKIWWLVGTFVLTSGILYFLLMTAWLNVFLVVGYVRPLTEFVALLAIGFGISHLYELAWTRGVIECEVGDVAQRQRTMSRIRDVVAAPVGIVSLVLIVGLAFAVNAIEFVCSAALPAIFTHVLALSDVSTFGYYAYIALYVVFFMLDDLIIFGLAAFAVQSFVDTRYAVFSRFAGGLVLIGLGFWMLMR
ncbi:glutaredoxin family protein [Methyloceanibacter sp. wino2]|uniref:glutaredoxin family protein n=1 Tax=Methyloceanibacter sp. wino2 TaxID=2170729 RepID=UPI001FE09215|nr:glutaredoxin family protein [Methyloceanibacter sp. wino2]